MQNKRSYGLPNDFETSFVTGDFIYIYIYSSQSGKVRKEKKKTQPGVCA